MSAKSPVVVYTVALTAAQRLQTVRALQDRQRYLKQLCGTGHAGPCVVDDLRQANAEALHIIGEAPEVELDASGEPLEDEPKSPDDEKLEFRKHLAKIFP